MLTINDPSQITRYTSISEIIAQLKGILENGWPEGWDMKRFLEYTDKVVLCSYHERYSEPKVREEFDSLFAQVCDKYWRNVPRTAK